MCKRMNLFLSLPVVLQSEIYQYDNTYRIFDNEDFKEELSCAYLRSRVSFKKCHIKISEYIEELIYDGNSCWHNKYGRIDPDDELLSKDLPNYDLAEDFLIVFNYYYDVLYFKILPKGACYENCNFFHNILHKTKIYDGYFQNDFRTNLSKKVLDNLCTGDTTMMNSYNMMNELIEDQISMYFVV